MLYHNSSGSSRQAILLIHGFCENHTCFNTLVQLLSKEYRVVCPDLPGFGNSDVVNNISMEMMADKVKELLDALHIKQCVMMGHSMGGYVSLSFAQKYPQYLKGMGLLHSTALSDNIDRIEKRKQVISFIEKNGKDLYIDNFIPTLFKDIELNKDLCKFLISEAKKCSQNGIIEAIKAMMLRNDNIHVLKEFMNPLFFAIGKYDLLIPENDMLKQASLCIQSEICYLSQSAHCGMLEEPYKLSEAILKYCNRIFANPNLE